MENNQLQIFNFEEKEIRTHLDDQDNIWWCLKDVCEVLGINNPSDVVSRIDSDGVVIIEGQNGRSNQGANFVNESNLYQIIFQSRKEEAKKFRRWVTSEVIPSIRKTGQYKVKALQDLTPEEIQVKNARAIQEKTKIMSELFELGKQSAMLYAMNELKKNGIPVPHVPLLEYKQDDCFLERTEIYQKYPEIKKRSLMFFLNKYTGNANFSKPFHYERNGHSGVYYKFNSKIYKEIEREFNESLS